MLAITNGKIVTISGKTIENGTVLVDNGKICAVGADVKIPEGAEIINAEGKWVTPGLIEVHTHIAVRNEPMTATTSGDLNENSSPIVPQVRASDSFNPRDMGIAATRRAGFTTCCTLPGSSNLVGGTGFVFKTRDGRVLDDLAVPNIAFMKFALGENPRRNFGSKDKMPKTRMGSAALLRETLFNAKVYSDAKLAGEHDASLSPKPDFKLEALVPVVRGEMVCRIHCHRADDIMTAIRIAEEFNLKFTLEHVTEGFLIADILAAKNVKCVIGPMMTGPYKEEVWARSLTTPGAMARAGVKICMTEDSGVMTKCLPAHVGECMAAGLSEDDAFRSLTINAAELLGMSDEIGTLEVGKQADISIFDGHPFCNFTHCETTIIGGEVYSNL